jgi:hypothetical protein
MIYYELLAKAMRTFAVLSRRRGTRLGFVSHQRSVLGTRHADDIRSPWLGRRAADHTGDGIGAVSAARSSVIGNCRGFGALPRVVAGVAGAAPHAHGYKAVPIKRFKPEPCSPAQQGGARRAGPQLWWPK